MEPLKPYFTFIMKQIELNLCNPAIAANVPWTISKQKDRDVRQIKHVCSSMAYFRNVMKDTAIMCYKYIEIFCTESVACSIKMDREGIADTLFNL